MPTQGFNIKSLMQVPIVISIIDRQTMLCSYRSLVPIAPTQISHIPQ
jgi:hypothetical protein